MNFKLLKVILNVSTPSYADKQLAFDKYSHVLYINGCGENNKILLPLNDIFRENIQSIDTLNFIDSSLDEDYLKSDFKIASKYYSLITKFTSTSVAEIKSISYTYTNSSILINVNDAYDYVVDLEQLETLFYLLLINNNAEFLIDLNTFDKSVTSEKLKLYQIDNIFKNEEES